MAKKKTRQENEGIMLNDNYETCWIVAQDVCQYATDYIEVVVMPPCGPIAGVVDNDAESLN